MCGRKTFNLALLFFSVTVCTPEVVYARQSPSASQILIAGLSANDERLAQKVTLHVEGLAIGDLLTLVSKKTGVTLTVEKDIADEKIILFTPARPLRDTLHDIVALFNNHWERLNPDKTLEKPFDKSQSSVRVQPFRYRMTRGLRAREYEDALANEPSQRLKAQLDQQVDQLSQSHEDVSKRSVTDHLRRNLLDPERRLATQVYASLDAQQKEQLFKQGCTNSLAFASLPPDEQQALEHWVAYHNIQEQQHAAQDSSLKIEHEWLHKAGIRMVLSCHNAHEIEVGVQMPHNSFLLVARLRATETHTLARHANPYTGKMMTLKISVPLIEITQLQGKADWIDRLVAFAEASQIPVLCDYFRTDTLPAADTSHILPSKVQGVALLDALSSSGHRVWWQGVSSLLLRSEEWYRLRQYEVPDRWIKGLIDSIQAHGGKPTYGDLLRLVELTSQQLEGLGMMYGIWQPSADRFREADGQRAMLELIQACGLDTTRSLLVTEEPPLQTEPVDFDQPGAKKPVDFEALSFFVPQAAEPAVDTVYARNYVTDRACDEPFRMYAYASYQRFYTQMPSDPARDRSMSERQQHLMRQAAKADLSKKERTQNQQEYEALTQEQRHLYDNQPQRVEKNYLRVVLHLSGTMPATTRPARLQGWQSAANVQQQVFIPMVLPHQRAQKTEIRVSS